MANIIVKNSHSLKLFARTTVTASHN